MQVIDTLVAAGAERVAVNIANALPRDRYVPYLCTTRADGPLDRALASDVIRLRLQRSSRFDVAGIARLASFIRQHRIGVLHAHSSAVFIARVAAGFAGNVKVIWHAHYGRYVEHRRPLLYRVATRRIGAVITVNQQLADWCINRLQVRPGRVNYIPNPVAAMNDDGPVPQLPGPKGARIVAVANFRPEKDHFTLLRAMTQVVNAVPQAHLLMAGKTNDADYLEGVRRVIVELGLQQSVTILGERHDVPAILRQCDIGVLSSVSEGLPMSLLEYGMAGLPAVATEAGQCAEVLNQGLAGILVPTSDSDRLASGMISLLQRPETRAKLGARLHAFVNRKYSAERIVGEIAEVYDAVTGWNRPRPPSFARGMAI
ncbi:MAG TPA: glycosyltransferase [Bryobacteraceae bacterium]|nr:glycosyltransferase [Bryobacteraceae bacterium]